LVKTELKILKQRVLEKIIEVQNGVKRAKKNPDQFLITHHHTSLILLLGNLFCTHVPPLSRGGDV
jgi:hypothetical protein